MKILYTAEASAAGGRTGTITTRDGGLELQLVKPQAMGGSGAAGTNPEELFAGGYAACFISTMDFLAKQDGLTPGPMEVDCSVSIGPNEDKPGYGLAVAMKVRLPGLSAAEADALIAKAHTNCPYSNATRGNIEVAITRVD